MGENQASEDEEDEHVEPVEPDRWALSLAKSVILSGTVSTILFVGAGLALLLGVGAAVGIAIAQSQTEGLGTSYTIAQACSALLSSLLPAGVMAASGAAIRLQISRVEAEYIED
jgi:hypothetical protein